MDDVKKTREVEKPEPSASASPDGVTRSLSIDEMRRPPVDEEGVTATLDLNQTFGSEYARIKAEALAQLDGDQTTLDPPVAPPPADGATVVISLPLEELAKLKQADAAAASTVAEQHHQTVVSEPLPNETQRQRAAVVVPPIASTATPPQPRPVTPTPPPPVTPARPVTPPLPAQPQNAIPPVPPQAAMPAAATPAARPPPRRSLIHPLLILAAIAFLAVVAIAGYFLLKNRRSQNVVPISTSEVPAETVTPPSAPTGASDTATSLPDAAAPVPEQPSASASTMDSPPAVPPATTSRRRVAIPAREPGPAPIAAPAVEEPPPEPVEVAPPKPVAPPAAEGDLVSVSDAGVTPPQVRKEAIPAYTARGAKGTVAVALLVDHHGRVAEAKIVKSSGNALLDNSALRAARKSLYTPATKDGVRVRVWITKRYAFVR